MTGWADGKKKVAGRSVNFDLSQKGGGKQERGGLKEGKITNLPFMEGRVSKMGEDLKGRGGHHLRTPEINGVK